MRTNVIAEVASNHGGDLHLAMEFVRVAASLGVDYVKFQSWQVAKLRNGPQDPQFDWFAKSELSDSDHLKLIAECPRRGTKFLTTVFDVKRVPFLASLGLSEIKVASPDSNSFRLLAELKAHFSHIMISTGLSTRDEIARTAAFMQDSHFTLLHSVSLYPTPSERANLSRLAWLQTLSNSIGYSDHTMGIECIKIAIARGVHFVEKHFCLSREGPGRACPWDATPAEMEEIVAYTYFIDNAAQPLSADIPPDIERARQFYIGRFGDNT